jgi:hypothetical protein
MIITRSDSTSAPKIPKRLPFDLTLRVEQDTLLPQQLPLLTRKLPFSTPMPAKASNRAIRTQNPMARNIRGEGIVPHSITDRSRASFV